MGLSFRLGKIPVRVHSGFLWMAAIFGLLDGDLRVLVAWGLIVFVSVMVHELGHATLVRAYGLEPRIDLHGLGGTTSWSQTRALSNGQRAIISLAGPSAGFLLGGLVALLGRRSFPAFAHDFVYDTLLWVNVGWGLLNLLPMLPLDGGNVMQQLLQVLTRGRGERPAYVVSIVVSALAVGAALLWRTNAFRWWAALLAASFVASNWRALKDLGAREHDAPMREPLERAYAALQRKDAGQVLALARPVALSSKTPPVRAEALQLLAFGFLLEGRVADADAAIAALPQGFAPHPSLVQLRSTTTPRADP
jgi:Zn-dependent protease